MEMYTDAERIDQVNNEGTTMTNAVSEERYRYNSNVMYNAFDLLNPSERKQKMIHFLKQHMYENHVLSLFLYRYGSYKHEPHKFHNAL